MVVIRPFVHVIKKGDERFGVVKVEAAEDTVYDINGEMYQGQDGLIALDALDKYSAIVVLGDLKFNPRRFEAREVLAGSSVPGGDLDVVKGNVISRTDNTVVLRKILEGVPKVAVVDRNCSYGHHGIWFQELKSSLYTMPEKKRPTIFGHIAGLGGRDITVETFRSIIEQTRKRRKPEPETIWVRDL